MDEFRDPVVAGRSPASAADVLEPLYDARGALKFLAWASITVGALQCLSVVGIVIGWLPIWIGVLLARTADRLERGVESQDGPLLREGMEALAKGVRIQAVLVLIGVALTLLWLVGLVLMAIGMAVDPEAFR